MINIIVYKVSLFQTSIIVANFMPKVHIWILLSYFL